MLHRRHIRVVRAHLTEADYSTSVSFASRGSAPCRADPHDAGPRAADNHAMVGSVLLVEDDNLVRDAEVRAESPILPVSYTSEN